MPEHEKPSPKQDGAQRRHSVIMAGLVAMTALSFSKDPEPWVWWGFNIFGLCCLLYALFDWLSEQDRS